MSLIERTAGNESLEIQLESFRPRAEARISDGARMRTVVGFRLSAKTMRKALPTEPATGNRNSMTDKEAQAALLRLPLRIDVVDRRLVAMLNERPASSSRSSHQAGNGHAHLRA